MKPPASRNRYNVSQEEVDASSRIVLEHLNAAMEQLRERRYDPAAAVQAMMQMSMRLYADLVDDDGDAIGQIRAFIDQWETDWLNADPAEIH